MESGQESAEKEPISDRKMVDAMVVHDAVRQEGEGELSRPATALAWSGFAAGLAMGLSLIGEGLLQARIDDEPWRPLITKLGYSLGFIIVTLGRQQLYTENTLTAMIPALERNALSVWLNVLRLWSVVLAANLLGALLVAWFATTEAFNHEFRHAFHIIGMNAMSSDPFVTFLKAIPAGWLIALIVWLGPAVPSSRLFVALILSYFVGLGEFTHVIAGSVETFYLVITDQLGVWTYTSGYLIPTLIGNTIGGVFLVAVINHAQTVSKK